MADQSSSGLGLPPTVWVVIILGLAGALAVTQRPFQDVRPGDSSAPVYRHAPSQDQDIESALQEFYTRRRSAAHCVGILLYIL